MANLTETFQNQIAKLSAVYCRIWLKGSQFIHTCYILFICRRANELFQNQTSQLTVKIAQDAIKRDVCWYGQKWPKAVTVTFTATRYLHNRNSYFYSYKARKNKYGGFSNLPHCFLHLNYFARNIKNQRRTLIDYHRVSILV